ncbi:MAG TPA: type II secretion system F family protein [Burkholderiales bacterium]|nr:type II secretion system F family protein [Burkholderiales bacterium]
MSLFAYKGRDGAGQLVRGVLEGTDSGAIATQLFNAGITPVEIGETRDGETSPPAAGSLFSRLTRPPIRNEDLLLFSRQMHALLKAGVPIMRALGGLQESATNSAFREVLRSVRENLDSGRPLSAALQRQSGVFSAFYIAMVYVGETTGQLEEIFLRLFNHLEFQEFMRNQVKSALRYPIFVVVAMAIALAVINLFVIPEFAKVYRGFGAELPALTRVLIGFSNFMVTSWPWLLAGLAGAFFAFRAYTRTVQGRYTWDRFKLRVPIAGKIVLKATLARFARSLSLSVRSGVPIVQGLTLVAQTVDNAMVAEKVDKMRDGVERGESVLQTAVHAGIFTPVVMQMIMVGEESGALDDMMAEIADMYQREVEYELRTLGAQIEPILIVCLGVVVLILALGVFLPIWDLGQAALKK